MTIVTCDRCGTRDEIQKNMMFAIYGPHDLCRECMDALGRFLKPLPKAQPAELKPISSHKETPPMRIELLDGEFLSAAELPCPKCNHPTAIQRYSHHDAYRCGACQVDISGNEWRAMRRPR